MTRTRTVRWQDPATGADAARAMSGLEYLQKVARGELPRPPVSNLLGFDGFEVGRGRAVFSLVPAEYHYNPIGAVHGGVTSTLCDSAMGCAVHSVLPAGSSYSTVELNVKFVRPVTRDTGRLICEGNVVHAGRKLATAEARVTDEAGKLYAHATTTCLVLS